MIRALVTVASLAGSVASAQSLYARGGGSVDTSGLCGVAMSCEVASLTVTGAATVGGTLTSGVAANSCAVSLPTNGRVCWADGTFARFSPAADGSWDFLGTLILRSGADVVGGFISNSIGGSVRVLGPLESTPTAAASLQTCTLNTRDSSTVAQGALVTVAAASDTRTRLCLCTSDGAGTPAAAWMNVTSGTVGTSTSCP